MKALKKQSPYSELESHSVDINALNRFIESRSRQFGLTNRCCSADVFHDVYLRWKKRSETGEPILDVEAWFRGAVYNRIREIKREMSRLDSYEPSILEELVAVEDDSLDTIAHEHVREAMKSLSPDQHNLLEMRFYQGLSWEEIACVFSEQQHSVTVSTLRKRGQRALEELRKKILARVKA